jgi:catechol 2,3-dioxygenase-like lactoylglutathione lyase family enzyme
MPELRSAAPTFLVPDVAATAEWYERNLGFRSSFFPKTPPFGYASLQRDGVEIMLLRLEGFRKPRVERPEGVWDAYIRMQGLREFYDEVRGRISLKSELTRRSYGDTEFELADPNGYVLVFGEMI